MLRRSLIGVLLGVALASCSTAQSLRAFPASPNSAALVGRAPTSGYQYETIFSFGGYDGMSPAGALLYHAGKLYGTTESGGYYSQGIVFCLTLSGKETVLHNFGQTGDGSKPEAGLAVLNGVLYGTTYSGGKYGDGVVFSITSGGQERVIYSFGRTSTDGENPKAGLTAVGERLYGTTWDGGTYNAGTVFVVGAAGRETVLFRFPSYSKKDGEIPYAGLTDYNGTLYATTDASGPCQEGTVFSITTSGKEHTIYGFPCNRYDGQNPQAGVTIVNGVLYGTTTGGGKAFYNDGTVYSVTTSGKEKVLFNFVPSTQYGDAPNTSLLALKGTLYGTTPGSGPNNAGTLYGVTPSGQPTVLHAFGVPPDGATPLAGLIDVHGTLYGTTSAGGGVANAGTVYRITP